MFNTIKAVGINVFRLEISFYICSIYSSKIKIKINDMKKYLFIFSSFALLATTACDTSSKATTTQTAVVAQQPQTVAAPIAKTDTAIAVMPEKKQFSKKAMKMQRAEMGPIEKGEMLRKPDEVPAKKQ
jgi:hypothetical protein